MIFDQTSHPANSILTFHLFGVLPGVKNIGDKCGLLLNEVYDFVIADDQSLILS